MVGLSWDQIDFWGDLIGIPWRIHGAAIYVNMDPINIPPMLAYMVIYTSTMGPMGIELYLNGICFPNCGPNSYFDPDSWAHFERKDLSSQTQLSEVSILVWWIVAWFLITQVGAVLQTAMAWWVTRANSIKNCTWNHQALAFNQMMSIPERCGLIIHRCTKHVYREIGNNTHF